MPTVDLGLVVGSNGQGVPTGGSAGQILAKNSSSNYDTGWVPMSAAAAAAFGIVENGNAASQTIAAGQYVIWKGVLYTADAAIASGTTLATSGGNKNLTAVSNGGLNALNSGLDTKGVYSRSEWFTDSERGSDGNLRISFNRYVMSIGAFTASISHAVGQEIGTIPEGYRPNGYIDTIGYCNGSPCVVRIKEDGKISIWNMANSTTGRLYFYATYFRA